MADLIIDPTDDSHAIGNDGSLLDAVRFLPAGSPMPPTVAELRQAPVLGYAARDSFTFDPKADDGGRQ